MGQPTYFKHFPEVNYRFSEPGKRETSLVAKDIMIRHIIIDEIMSNTATFYEYIWQDEDRPETVAYDYYGSEGYYWVVLLSTNTYDPYYDFPIPRFSFDKYLTQKYSYLQSDADEWFNDMVSGNVSPTVRNEVIGSFADGGSFYKADTLILFLQSEHRIHHYEDDEGNIVSSNDPSASRSISFYDMEYFENEEKRKVKLLDRRYLSQFVSEAEDKMKKIAKDNRI